MKPHLLLTVLLLSDKIVASALLLGHRDSNVKVLVFGDSWGEWGPSWHMLEDMFARHGVAATVRSAAETGTRACQWAKMPKNLALAAKNHFPSNGPDFVWYTLGYNDLLDKQYIACTRASAFDFQASLNCLRVKTKEINSCTETLLSNLWKAWPNTKVVQCGYDFKCEGSGCEKPEHKGTYCGYNITCRNVMFYSYWQDMFLHQPDPRYTGINIVGALQQVVGMTGAAIGHPRLDQGSPCTLVDGCSHPIPGGMGAWIIGEAFWKLYFSRQVKSTVARHYPPISISREEPVQLDTEQHDTFCKWDWVPNLEKWTPSPKCRNGTDVQSQ